MREKMKTPRRRAWRHKATAFLLTAALALGWLNFFPQPAKAATINSAADLHDYYKIRMVFDVTNTTTTTVSKAGCEASYIGFALADGQGASFYLNKTICTQKGSYTLADNYLCTSDYGFPPYNTLFKNEMDRTRNFGGTIHVYIYDYINERYVEMTMDDPGKTASVSGQQDLVMNRLHLPEEEYLKYAFIERESTDLTLTGDMTTTYDFPAVTYGSQYGVKRVMKRGYNTVTYELTGYDSKGQALAACGASVNADTGQMTLDPAAALAAGTASVKVTARASFVGQSAAPIAVDHTYNLSYPVVSFDANGGSCTVDQTRMFSGAKIGTLPTPTHTGDVSFAGWYTASSGGDLVTADTPITSSQTLYARWQNNTHAVRYHAGSGTGAPTDNTAYVKDDTVTVRFDQTPTLANHKFLGWATSEGASAPLYRQNGTTSFAMGASVTYSTDGMSYSAQNPTFTNVTNGPQTVYYLVEKANYESVSGSLTLEIAAAAMADEVTATGGKYTYDGTARSISVTAPAGASVTYSTDGVSYSTQNPTFTNVTNGPQTVYYLVEKANYESVSGTLGVEITPRSVVVSGLTVSDKVYDQNTTATPVTQNAVLTGKIASDELTVRVSAHFLDADAGENKPVYFSNMSLTGAKAGNYEIDPASQTSTTATISKALPAAP